MPDPTTWNPSVTNPGPAPVAQREAQNAQDDALAADLERRERELAQAQAERRRAENPPMIMAPGTPYQPVTLAPNDPAVLREQEAQRRVQEARDAKHRKDTRNAAAAATQDARNGAARFDAAVAAPNKQRYQVAVPHSGTQLTFGASQSRGGAGASLVTQGSVLVDSCGPADFQSAGAMALQTSSTLSAICNSNGLFGSVASITVSAGSQVKVYSGSAVAPGSCGTGAPGNVATADMPPPAGGADQAVARRQVLNSAAKLAVDGASLVGGVRGFERSMESVAGVTSGGGDVLGDIAGLGQDIQTATGYENPTLAKVLNKTATAADGLTALGSYNPVGTVNAVSDLGSSGGNDNSAGSSAGSGGSASNAAAGGGGGTKIDMQAPDNIEMRSMASITGTAVANVEYKAGNKVSLKAGSVVEGTAMHVSMFGTVKVEIKSGVLIDVFSGGLINMATPMWRATVGKLTFKVLASGLIETGASFMVNTPAVVRITAAAGTQVKSGGRILLKSDASVDLKAPKVNIVAPDIKAQGKVKVTKKLTCDDDVKMDKKLSVKLQMEAKTGKLKQSLQVLGALKAG